MIPWLVLGGLNVGMSAMKAQQAAKQRQQEAALRAAEVEASPWTGKAPSTAIATSKLNPWAEMAGGAVNTLGQMTALKQAGLLGPTDQTASSMIAEAPIKKEAPLAFKENPYALMYRQQNSSKLNPWE